MKNDAREPRISSVKFIIIISLFFEIILNLSLWRFVFARMEINSPAAFLFAASQPVFIFTGLYLIFSLLIWPRIYKPILAAVIILSSVANYVMFQYGIFIDSDMVRNVFETNQCEALDYINLNGLLWLTLTGLLPSVLAIKLKVKFQPLWREIKTRTIYAAICVLALSLVAAGLYKEYVVFGRNNRQVTRLINPVNYVYGAWRYFQRQALAKRKFARIDEKVRHAPYEDDHLTVFVLIIGETARSMNFSLNGYAKPTNPQLKNQDVISFKDVTASGTSTAVSLPAMFSHLPRAKFNVNQAAYFENIIDLLVNAGYEVIWLENDNGCKQVCDRTLVRDMVAENNPKYCGDAYCFDEVMLEPLENILSEIKKDPVIVLHAIGSHGPSYYNEVSSRV